MQSIHFLLYSWRQKIPFNNSGLFPLCNWLFMSNGQGWIGLGGGEGQGCQDDSFQLDQQQNPENLGGGRWRSAKFGKPRKNSTHMLYASLCSLLAGQNFCQGAFSCNCQQLQDLHTFAWFSTILYKTKENIGSAHISITKNISLPLETQKVQTFRFADSHVWKLSSFFSGKISDFLETFKDIQTTWKLTRQSKNFWDHLETFQICWTLESF